jgi:hypothetical protein
MDSDFLGLSPDDRRDALNVAADISGRPAYILEKDIWVVWTLDKLCKSSLGEDLIFKGGTSLSKAYGIISRFSEDIDLTYDIRSMAPDLVKGKMDEFNFDVAPPTVSQASKWTKTVRERLPNWIESNVKPVIATASEEESVSINISLEGHKILLGYESVTGGHEYVAPNVMLEFGARSTGEPTNKMNISCDASGLVDNVNFPNAVCTRVMSAKRTFWEKATAVHVFCLGGKGRGPRFSRHFHDLVRLDDAGVAEDAIADKNLAKAVANHKTMFFSEKNAGGEIIDYFASVKGGLCLVPDDERALEIKDDYDKMVESGLLLEEAEPFEGLIECCSDIANRANH